MYFSVSSEFRAGCAMQLKEMYPSVTCNVMLLEFLLLLFFFCPFVFILLSHLHAPNLLWLNTPPYNLYNNILLFASVNTVILASQFKMCTVKHNLICIYFLAEALGFIFFIFARCHYMRNGQQQQKLKCDIKRACKLHIIAFTTIVHINICVYTHLFFLTGCISLAATLRSKKMKK